MNKKPLRPEIPVNLRKPLERYALAHSVSTTAAVALLLTAALRQQKYIPQEEKQ